MKLKIIFILALICLSKQALSYPYTEIYVFGDSLSDTGRLFEATNLPPSPYFKGRMSNGKLWIEELADTLNLTYNPDTNFAFVGARSGTGNGYGDDLPGLQQQVDFYLKNNSTADANALYVVWAGANDFFSGITNITSTINNIVTAVSKLRQHGAKHILVPNLPPLDKTPRAINRGNSAVLSQITTTFNKGLAQKLAAFDVIQIDMVTAFEMIKTPDVVTPPLGNLNNMTDACFDRRSFKICENPDEYLYWDDIHPTTVGHKAIALVFFAAIAESVYVDFSQIDPSEPHLLELPFIEVTDEGGKFLVLDVGMSREVDDSEFQFSVLGSVIQTTVSLQNLFTFPSNYQYPSFNQATGILTIPIVHIAQMNSSLTFLAEYKTNLKFLPDTLNHPLIAPTFELDSAN
jgi:thermolabile hemolysin